MEIYIDDSTDEQLLPSDIRQKAQDSAPPGASIGLKSEELWDTEYLSQWGVSVIEIIETEPPEVSAPSYAVDAGWDKSTPGQWTQQWEVVDPNLDEARAFSLARLNRDFDASLQPVEHDGKLWRPGIASASAIRDVVDMTEFAGGAHVILADSSDEVHEYALADARLVSVQIGAVYQAGYMDRAAKRRAIADAETAAEALAVVWDDPV